MLDYDEAKSCFENIQANFGPNSPYERLRWIFQQKVIQSIAIIKSTTTPDLLAMINNVLDDTPVTLDSLFDPTNSEVMPMVMKEYLEDIGITEEMLKIAVGMAIGQLSANYTECCIYRRLIKILLLNLPSMEALKESFYKDEYEILDKMYGLFDLYDEPFMYTPERIIPLLVNLSAKYFSSKGVEVEYKETETTLPYPYMTKEQAETSSEPEITETITKSQYDFLDNAASLLEVLSDYVGELRDAAKK